jgi:hypothetical protein
MRGGILGGVATRRPPMHLTDAGRALIQKRLKEARLRTAKEMERILAGQDLRLDEIPLPQEADPSEPPLERLRRFAAMLADVAGRFGTEAYGRCAGCGDAVPERDLVELPWADRCPRCR